jgi:hypothetical protein
MTQELVSLFLGTGVGALTKVIGSFVQASLDLNKAQLQTNIETQKLADESHDKASLRGGQWVRRIIVCVCLFGVVIVPFVMAFMEAGVTVSRTNSFLFFEWETWKTLGGFVILPEIRTTLIAIVGYYFGASSIKRT